MSPAAVGATVQLAGTVFGVVLTISTIVFATLTLKDRRSTDYIGRLETDYARMKNRAETAEGLNSHLQVRIVDLEEENLRLMKKILHMNGGEKKTP